MTDNETTKEVNMAINNENPATEAAAPENAAPKTVAQPFTRREWLLALAALLISALFVQCAFYAERLGAGITLCGCALAAAGYTYLRATGAKPCRESYLYLVLFLASLALYALNGAAAMKGLRFLSTAALFAYWLCAAAGARAAEALSPNAAFEVCAVYFCAPFQGAGGAARGLTGNGAGKKKLPLVFAAVAVAVPLLIVVLSLLSGADRAFKASMDAFRGSLAPNAGDATFRALSTLLIAFFTLSALLFILRDKRGARAHDAPKKRLPALIPCVVISLLCLVYLLFFAAQAGSVAQVLRARREGFSYSDFAREGFFQLCAVCGINFAVVLTANYLADAKPLPLRVLLTLLGACTLLLTASALFKMALYIGAYGLTPLRMVTTWFMLALAVAFVMIILSQWRENTPVFKVSALTLCVSFILLCGANPAKLAADYNADAYLRGALLSFDYESPLDNTPFDAADALHRVLTEGTDAALKKGIAQAITERPYLTGDTPFLARNLTDAHGAEVYRAMVASFGDL